MSYTILQASSIPEAFDVTVKFLSSWLSDPTEDCWFRGIKDSAHTLQPGACWRKSYDEVQVMISFCQDGVAFQSVGSLDEWDAYYLAQHHRIPTRLLDWTESFCAALFFAFDDWDEKTTPCIWILIPGLFNKVFLGWDGVVTPENNPETKNWLPRTIAKSTHTVVQDALGYCYDNEWPLAIFPKKSNKRIHSQQGTFTVHGRLPEPVDMLVKKKGGDPQTLLARLDLTGFKKVDVLRNLGLLGIRRSAIYPDIDGLVKEMQQKFNW